jgi:hypothetical protein
MARGTRADALFSAIYRPVSLPFHTQPGSLERWLTERYCYYSVAKKRAYRCEIAHAQWRLQRARAIITENTMASALGIELPDCEPLLYYAHRMDAIFWRPLRAQSAEYEEGRTRSSGSPVLPGTPHRADQA